MVLFRLVLVVHTVSSKHNSRYVGGERKEDEIIVWFRVRKWACEEEKKKNEARFWYLRAFVSSTFYFIHLRFKHLKRHIMFGLQEPLQYSTGWKELVVEQQRHGTHMCGKKLIYKSVFAKKTLIIQSSMFIKSTVIVLKCNL